MELQKATIIRSTGKIKTATAKSEYLFHFSSIPSQDNICFFEGFYKEPGLKAGMHIHKTMTEVFSVLEGEFTFHLREGDVVLYPNDTIVASPFQAHGFSSNLPDSRMTLISVGFVRREEFFLELEKIATGKITLNEDELEAFFNRYDQYSVK